jgi:acyl-CoA synthetase (AMP-forming)/AMP-acid ligase II
MTPKTGPALPTLPAYIDHYAALAPDRPALRTESGPVSYRALADAVERTARALLAAGVTPGDRVGLLSTPRPEFVVCYLAATKIGAIWFGLNPRYTVPEIAYVLGDAEPRLVLSVEEFEGRRLADDLRQAARDAGQGHAVHVLGPAGPLLAVDGELDAAGAGVDPAAVAARAAAVDAQDVAILVYTSGSTGRPKGALLRHSGLVRLGRVQTAAYRVDKATTIGDGPINHVGMPGDILAMVAVSGGSLRLHERFDAGATLAAIERDRVNMIMTGATQLQRIVDHPDFAPTDLTSLQVVAWGGAALPLPAIRRLRSRGLPLITTYGSSEATSSVSYADFDAPDDVLAETVGRPDPELDVRLLRANGGWAGPGEEGEVCLRHPTLMAGYLGAPDATAEAFTPDGYLRMGDIGVLREDGNLRLVARTKQVFRSGGYNIYPREIELALESHPSVKLAAVVPRPDPGYQEVGVAYVELQPDAQATPAELLGWARGQLANYKVPKTLVLLAELPTLPNEKIDKRRLQRLAAGTHDDPELQQLPPARGVLLEHLRRCGDAADRGQQRCPVFPQPPGRHGVFSHDPTERCRGAEPAVCHAQDDGEQIYGRDVRPDPARFLSGGDRGDTLLERLPLGHGRLRPLQDAPRGQTAHLRVGEHEVETGGRERSEVPVLQRYGLHQRLDMPGEHGAEELILVPEVHVQEPLVGSGALGDPVDAGPGEPVFGELLAGRGEQQFLGRLGVARPGRRRAGGRGDHASKLAEVTNY